MTEFDIAAEIRAANALYLTPEYMARVQQARTVFLMPLATQEKRWINRQLIEEKENK
jgi:hypothetical protein